MIDPHNLTGREIEQYWEEFTEEQLLSSVPVFVQKEEEERFFIEMDMENLQTELGRIEDIKNQEIQELRDRIVMLNNQIDILQLNRPGDTGPVAKPGTIPTA